MLRIKILRRWTFAGYTPPSTPPANPTVTITAISQLDASASDSVSFTISS